MRTDAAVFEELVKASTLPFFATDFGQQAYPNRINIPLSDEGADVTFYLAEKGRKKG